MTKHSRFRGIFAPSAQMAKSSLIAIIGLVISVVGAILSFQLLIRPLLDQVSDVFRRWVETRMVQIPGPVGGEDPDLIIWLIGLPLMILGLALVFVGGRMAFKEFVGTLNPDLQGGMVDAFVQKQRLSRGPRVVVMGGGTGLSTLLRGLKNHTSNITAIVTVTDDGGSSGRLVQEKGMIPPGDIRNCLVALADAETSMTALFQHRFQKDSGSLSGHSMGNLLIAALVDQASGDFEKAVGIASDVLNIRGRVVPATLDHVRLKAVLDDGREIMGETAIVQSGSRIRRIHLDPVNCTPHRAAVEAILDADLICIGPGSVYTSIIPNLLVPGISQALRDADAPRVYICNVMTQPGESDRFTASEHVTAIQINVEKRIFDHVMVNTSMPSQNAIEKYREYGQHVVEPDIDIIRTMGFRTVTGNFISETDVVRHDPARLAARLIQLATGRRRR